MDGTSMADWFKRRSPSKWMQGLMDEARKGIDAGWERQRNVVGQITKRIAAIALETGLWSHANRTMVNNWTAREFRHVTRQDEKVCNICGPRDGKVFSGASNGPPLHPRCRCGCPSLRDDTPAAVLLGVRASTVAVNRGHQFTEPASVCRGLKCSTDSGHISLIQPSVIGVMVDGQ